MASNNHACAATSDAKCGTVDGTQVESVRRCARDALFSVFTIVVGDTGTIGWVDEQPSDLDLFAFFIIDCFKAL